MVESMGQAEATEELARASARSQVLTKAILRVAVQLGLGQAELAKVIGISASSASRMHARKWTIPENTKSWELAALLVRVFRSLDAFVGGSEKHVKQWFRSENLHLGGSPASLVVTIEGLTNVARYLDAMRGAQ